MSLILDFEATCSLVCRYCRWERRLTFLHPTYGKETDQRWWHTHPGVEHERCRAWRLRDHIRKQGLEGGWCDGCHTFLPDGPNTAPFDPTQDDWNGLADWSGLADHGFFVPDRDARVWVCPKCGYTEPGAPTLEESEWADFRDQSPEAVLDGDEGVAMETAEILCTGCGEPTMTWCQLHQRCPACHGGWDPYHECEDLPGVDPELRALRDVLALAVRKTTGEYRRAELAEALNFFEPEHREWLKTDDARKTVAFQAHLAAMDCTAPHFVAVRRAAKRLWPRLARGG